MESSTKTDTSKANKKLIIGAITGIFALVGGIYTVYQISQEAIRSLIKSATEEQIEYLYDEMSQLKLDISSVKDRVSSVKSEINRIEASIKEVELDWLSKVNRTEILIETAQQTAIQRFGQVDGNLGSLDKRDQDLEKRLIIQEYIEQERQRKEALRRQPISPEREAEILKKLGITQQN